MFQPSLIELPAAGTARWLFLLFHGVGSQKEHLQPLAEALQAAVPEACCLVVDGFEPFDAGPIGRQWFSIRGVNEDNRPARVSRALPAFIQLVETLQAKQGIDANHTVLVGFSQGTIMSLEAAQARPDLTAAVLAFSGRYAELPTQPPGQTRIHLLHGGRDGVIPVAHARDAEARLRTLGAEVSLDTDAGADHSITPALFQHALERLAPLLRAD